MHIKLISFKKYLEASKKQEASVMFKTDGSTKCIRLHQLFRIFTFNKRSSNENATSLGIFY